MWSDGSSGEPPAVLGGSDGRASSIPSTLGQADQSSTAANASLNDAQATQNADEIPAEYSIDDGPKEVLDEDSVFKQVAPQRRIRDGTSPVSAS